MLVEPSGPRRIGGTGWLFCSSYEHEDGTPAEPPTLTVAVPNMGLGDTIPLGKRTLWVIGKRDDDADQPPVLIVEEAS